MNDTAEKARAYHGACGHQTYGDGFGGDPQAPPSIMFLHTYLNALDVLKWISMGCGQCRGVPSCENSYPDFDRNKPRFPPHISIAEFRKRGKLPLVHTQRTHPLSA